MTTRIDTASDIDDRSAGSNEKYEAQHNEGKLGHVVPTDDFGHVDFVTDPKAERALRWRIDLHIMPLVMLMYLWCFIDRTNIGNARLYRLEADLGMRGFDYNIALTSFFVAYVVCEYPCMILNKWIGPGKWLPFLTVSFGLISLLTCLVDSYAGLCVNRAFLGMTESGLMPGLAYYLSRWYRKDELVFRISLYVAMAPLAGAFGGLLAYGIVNDLDNIASLTSWRMLFFIEGLVTCFVGILTFFTLADSPRTARWLSPEQKDLAERRIMSESVGLRQAVERLHSETVRSGVFNINTWILGLIFLFNSLTVQGIAVFLPTIVTAMYPGVSPVQRNLRTVPPYVCGLVWVLLMSFLAWKTKRRAIWMLLTSPLAMVGYMLFMFGGSPSAQYAGAFAVAIGSFAMGSLLFAYTAANLSPDAARASGIGFAAVLQNMGGLISPWQYLPTDAPRYFRGHGLGFACAALQFILTLVVWAYQVRENRLRRAGKRDHRLEGRTPDEIALLGHRHPHFMYTH